MGKELNEVVDEIEAIGFFKGKKITKKHKLVIAAATKLFAEKGYASTTTKEISELAGVAEKTMFSYYKSKKVLMMKTLGEFLSKYKLIDINALTSGKIFEEDNNLSMEDALINALTNIFGIFQRFPVIFKSIIRNAHFHENLREIFLKFWKENQLPKLLEIINCFKKNEELIDVPTNEIANLLFSLFNGYFLTQTLGYSEWNLTLDETVKLFSNFIINGLKKK